jgi:hypothetical protein
MLCVFPPSPCNPTSFRRPLQSYKGPKKATRGSAAIAGKKHISRVAALQAVLRAALGKQPRQLLEADSCPTQCRMLALLGAGNMLARVGAGSMLAWVGAGNMLARVGAGGSAPKHNHCRRLQARPCHS